MDDSEQDKPKRARPPMTVSFSEPGEFQGHIDRTVTILDDDDDVMRAEVSVSVSVKSHDSRAVLAERTKIAAIPVLERALEALRTAEPGSVKLKRQRI